MYGYYGDLKKHCAAVSFSNYAPTMFIQQEAAAKGCQQVLWLFGEEEQITEVGAMNLFMFWTNEQGGKFIRNQLLTSCFKLRWFLSKHFYFL